MRTFALATLLPLTALAAGPARASEPPPHTCDGDVCKIELPPVPDPASGVEVEDPFALTPAPRVASSRPAATVDLDPTHVPPPAPSVRRPLLAWTAIIGASIASVVAGALVVRRLETQRAHTDVEIEHEAASLRMGAALRASAPAR